MNIDILQIIINYCDVKTQIRCMMIDTYTYDNVYIYSLNTEMNYRVDQNVIEQKKFSRIKYLNCSNNEKIKNLNHLAETLKTLKCIQFSGIDQNGISNLKKLKSIDCSLNQKINSVSHLGNTLEELYCSEWSGITQNGINGLKKLKIMDCSGNKEIYNVNSMSETLEILDISTLDYEPPYLDIRECGITQDGIAKLKKIQVLKCSLNDKIYNVNHLSDTLEILMCSGSNIDQQGISKLKIIKKLDCG